MKLKIQQAYGKNEVAKFKASNNWLQCFKKRHNTALRNRKKQKKDSADDARATVHLFHRELRNPKEEEMTIVLIQSMADGFQVTDTTLTKYLFHL